MILEIYLGLIVLYWKMKLLFEERCIYIFFLGGEGEEELLLFIRNPTTFAIQYVLHLYKAGLPQSGTFNTGFLTPYIIPIQGLDNPV